MLVPLLLHDRPRGECEEGVVDASFDEERLAVREKCVSESAVSEGSADRSDSSWRDDDRGHQIFHEIGFGDQGDKGSLLRLELPLPVLLLHPKNCCVLSRVSCETT